MNAIIIRDKSRYGESISPLVMAAVSLNPDVSGKLLLFLPMVTVRTMAATDAAPTARRAPTPRRPQRPGMAREQLPPPW